MFDNQRMLTCDGFCATSPKPTVWGCRKQLPGTCYPSRVISYIFPSLSTVLSLSPPTHTPLAKYLSSPSSLGVRTS
jgi:hypothetical protein